MKSYSLKSLFSHNRGGDKVKDLLKAPIFSELSGSQLEKLAALLPAVLFKKGEYIFKEENQGKVMYVCLKGSLEVIKEENGRVEVLNVLMPGDLLGEFGLLYERPRIASVRAVEDSQAVLITKENFVSLKKWNPHIWESILKIIGVRMSDNWLRESKEFGDLDIAARMGLINQTSGQDWPEGAGNRMEQSSVCILIKGRILAGEDYFYAPAQFKVAEGTDMDAFEHSFLILIPLPEEKP